MQSPDEEYEVHEGPELNRPAVSGALRVFSGPEAEVEANGDQVFNVVRSSVGGDGYRYNNSVNNFQGGGILLSDRGILEPLGIELPREALGCVL